MGGMATIAMSRKERQRLEVFGRVRDGELTVVKAGELLGLSLRQARRVYRRFAEQGDAGLAHRLRGKASNRKLDAATREAVLGLCRGKYAGFGPTLGVRVPGEGGARVEPRHAGPAAAGGGAVGAAAQAEPAPQPAGEAFVRGGVGADGRQPPRLVRAGGGPASPPAGAVGSPPCERACLMVMVDDATSRVFCRLYEKESREAAFDVLGRYAGLYGLPRALYTDRAGIYRSDEEPTAEQEAAGEEPVTQFGRAMKELGVGLILAGSPQAKGRVERMNRTLQDRLVKALRLAGVATMGAANDWLERDPFLAEFNERFRVEAADPADVHRPVAEALEALRSAEPVLEVDELGEVLCVAEERVVGQDWCVRWKGRWLQIDEEHERLGLAGKRVEVREKADGVAASAVGRPQAVLARGGAGHARGARRRSRRSPAGRS